MALSQLFWDVLMPWNLKSTYFSLKIIHFLRLNIWYIIYVVFWIKYWNLKLPHHCILFLFTICTVSQLFWNGVCRVSLDSHRESHHVENIPVFLCLRNTLCLKHPYFILWYLFYWYTNVGQTFPLIFYTSYDKVIFNVMYTFETSRLFYVWGTFFVCYVNVTRHPI